MFNVSTDYNITKKTPLSGVFIYSIGLITVGILGGKIYNYISLAIPIDGIKLLLAIRGVLPYFYGIFLGFIFDNLFRLCKIEKDRYSMVLLLSFFTCFYCMWVTWEAILLDKSIISLLFNPYQLWLGAEKINMQGIWSLLGDKSETGSLVWLVWFCEPFLLLYGFLLLVFIEPLENALKFFKI